ncbi:hypothetical protein STRCI_000908 [Streptomyces cinnabarinus]|uniref:SMI1/KNR4 family protein n=1 Tax=Streptomyces cinnabarinus TaxID=67287 RepID=A0ABY7K5P7_9ACTN|nr:hypothetical protein [Streptomyces cinnabarinus]WAZ19831.1 hypothetical protein STRCI_000908 [Streptomyces cinnabarinus]
MTANNEEEFRYPFEARCAELLREIGKAPELDVHVAQLEEIIALFEDAESVFEELAEDDGLPLSRQIQDCFFRYGSVDAAWRYRRPETALVGEFKIRHILSAIGNMRMTRFWKGEDDVERALYKDLRIIDDNPQTGSGRMSLLRATPGAANPEIWFFDMRQGAIPMELDYPAYLETVMVTKGVIGWQYLYCAPELCGEGFFPLVEGLTEMLDVFPSLFPAHDYTDLRARLEERL